MCNVFSRDISNDLQINNNIVDLKEQRTVLWTPLHSWNWKVEIVNWVKVELNLHMYLQSLLYQFLEIYHRRWLCCSRSRIKYHAFCTVCYMDIDIEMAKKSLHFNHSVCRLASVELYAQNHNNLLVPCTKPLCVSVSVCPLLLDREELSNHSWCTGSAYPPDHFYLY